MTKEEKRGDQVWPLGTDIKKGEPNLARLVREHRVPPVGSRTTLFDKIDGTGSLFISRIEEKKLL